MDEPENQVESDLDDEEVLEDALDNQEDAAFHDGKFISCWFYHDIFFIHV